MLRIGIDEAGYGPLLGPLCHGYCALRDPDVAGGEPPDVWRLLHPGVMRHPAAAGAVTVDDSKKIHAAAQGFKVLHDSVGAFLDCLPEAAVPVHSLYERLLPPGDRARLDEDMWNAPPNAANREQHRPSAPPAFSGAAELRRSLAAAGVNVVALGARALSAKHFNAALQNGRNKADVNWSVAAEQLRRLLAFAQPGETVHVAIDRQGGRKFYSGPLGDVFPGALPRVVMETAAQSVYGVEWAGCRARVAFKVSADAENLPVALASMAAKLTRELCMERLNAFFARHLPELRPTAGYYTDAMRFLGETQTLRKKLGISDQVFVRNK
jgi:hypothetical protein